MRVLPQVREHGIRANSISLCVIENGATRIQLENTEWVSYMLWHDTGTRRRDRGGRKHRTVPGFRRELIPGSTLSSMVERTFGDHSA